ncbi:hypothetical protein N8T08_007552 [Aspergillus melleus]|uniref:Uncharacterized protein n=1 Tax=Aspergillus melleus TaxID=138277 RepID=A0ACC3AXL1_9EURO|nr:hypothetical protein N8T08_007552 [Aspergillus melleus]
MSRSITSSTGSILSTGSRFEECYASPRLVLKADPGSPGSPSSDGRSRRNKSSSDESSGPGPAWDNFLNEDLRAGGPYLCSIPLKTTVLPRTHRLSGPQVEIEEHVRRILSEHAITPTYVHILQRQSVVEPELVPIVTVYIEASRRRVDGTWVAAARKVLEMMRQRGHVGLSVEIADKAAFDPLRFATVYKTDRIFSLWKEVYQKILREGVLQKWMTLSCWRVGTSVNSADNPPTVIVTVPLALEGDWRHCREGVVRILDQFNLPNVAVRIHKDSVSLFQEPDDRIPLETSYLKLGAQVGHSIGIRGLDLTSGTFGGFVQLLNQRGQWVDFGISCSHCALAPQEMIPASYSKEVQTWRVQGIRPVNQMAEKCIKFDQPSVRDLTKEVKALQDRINAITSTQAYKDTAQALQDGEFVIPYTERNSTLINRPRNDTLLHDEELYKCGRKTGYTSGKYNGLDTCRLSRRIVDGKEVEVITIEHTITGNPFSDIGDSGALVFDRIGGVVGLIFRGHRQSPIIFFTHFIDLFEDIKASTGAKDVRIK